MAVPDLPVYRGLLFWHMVVLVHDQVFVYVKFVHLSILDPYNNRN